MGYYLYLLNLSSPSGNAGVVVAVESKRKQAVEKRKARTASLWDWLSHMGTSALSSLFITALVAAQ